MPPAARAAAARFGRAALSSSRSVAEKQRRAILDASGDLGAALGVGGVLAYQNAGAIGDFAGDAAGAVGGGIVDGANAVAGWAPGHPAATRRVVTWTLLRSNPTSVSAVQCTR